MSRILAVAVVMIGVVGGCSLQRGVPGKPAVSQTQPGGAKARLDLQTRDDLRLFGWLLSRHDVLRARIVAEGLRGRIPEGDEVFKGQLGELDRQLSEQDVEVGKGYLWAHKPPTDAPLWREASAMAEGYLKRFGGAAFGSGPNTVMPFAGGRTQEHKGSNKQSAGSPVGGKGALRGPGEQPHFGAGGNRTGVAVLRVRVEDLDREDRVGVFFPGLTNCARWGSNNSSVDLGSGEFLFLGRNQPDRGAGQVEIQALQHASPKLAIEVPESGVVCAGELLIRLLPEADLGALLVRVQPEPGLPLDNAEVRIGRGAPRLDSSYAVQPDGTCLIEGIGAGACEPYAWATGVFCSQHRRAQVTAGQTTEVDLPAYAYRRVVVEWKYRRLDGKDGWHAGTTTAKTGEHGGYKPFRLDEGGGYVFALSEWSGTGAEITEAEHWRMVPAEPGDFDPPQVRASREELRQAQSARSPIGVGKVFAMHCFDPSLQGEAEAVIRIRSIEPAVPLTPVANAPGLRPGATGNLATGQTQPVAAQTRPAGGDVGLDLQTRDDLRLLGQFLERHDVLRARILAERLIGQVPEGDETFARHLDELSRQLAAQEVEVGKGYLWAHKPLTDDPRWQEVLGNVKERAGWYPKYAGRWGIAIFRIQLEDADREAVFGVLCEGVATQFFLGSPSRHQELRAGQPLVLAKGYEPGLPFGLIKIEAMLHACPKLPIELPESGIACAGDLLVRTVPQEQQGSIHVRVIPEAGISLVGGMVYRGHGFAPRQGGHPVQPDGSCVIDGVGPGVYGLYVEAPKLFRSPYRQVRVAAGQATEVELQAYGCRRVVLDWKCRRLGGDGRWREGTDTVLTGTMGPTSTWESKGSRYQLTPWEGNGTRISALGGTLMLAEPADFDVPQVRFSAEAQPRNHTWRDYPVAVGAVFALRYGDSRRDDEGEAVFRIRTIEPVVPLTTQAATQTTTNAP